MTRLIDKRFFPELGDTHKATITANIRGQREVYLEDVEISNIEPVDGELRERFLLEGGATMFHCFVLDGSLDIKKNHALVFDGVEYTIKGLEVWKGAFGGRGMSDFILLVLEEA